MPLYLYKCKCGKTAEKLCGAYEEDKHCECGLLMERQFTPTRMTLLNRSKPGSFKHKPSELNANKDMWESLRVMENKPKKTLHENIILKEEHKRLKDIVEH